MDRLEGRKGVGGLRTNQDHNTENHPQWSYIQHILTIRQLFRGPIHSPWLGDKVDSGIGLSYRPARLHRLASRYNNPMPESTISPIQGLWIWLQFASYQLFWYIYNWEITLWRRLGPSVCTLRWLAFEIGFFCIKRQPLRFFYTKTRHLTKFHLNLVQFL
jgi:hypothetical protein